MGTRGNGYPEWLGRSEEGKVRERRHVSDQRESGEMWIISDREQWVDHDVAESPQKAAEDTKAQEEPGQGSLLLQ